MRIKGVVKLMKYAKDPRVSFTNMKAFTLTEVLIAVGIVGVIAALVLPSVISYYQTTAMNKQYDRVKQTLSDSLRGLAVAENKVNFGDTTMWVKSEGSLSYDNTSGLFLKKYLRLSKYLGEGSSSKAKEAFADEYYSFDNADGSSTAGKKRITFSPDVSGACAILKSGAAICLKPQVGTTSAHGIIDLNGKRGPNVKGRDYRELVLSMVEFSDAEDIIAGTNPTDVIILNHENIIPKDDNPCGVDDYSLECCMYKNEEGAITDSGHPCCDNPAVASQIPVCAKDITLRVNLYPSQCKLNRATSIKKCSPRPYVQASQTTAKQSGKSISTLPALPPNLYLFCDGQNVGYLSSSDVKRAVETNGSAQIPFTITYPSCSPLFCLGSRNPTCGYQSGEGIKSTKSSVVFTENGAYKDYKYNGINWTVTYY